MESHGNNRVSLPHAVLENEKAKVYWNVPFIHEKP